MKSKRLTQFALAMAIGSLSFWSPIVAAHFLFGGDWGALLTIFPLTFALPLLGCLELEAFTHQAGRERLGFAGAMLLGIWITAPFWITLAGTAVPGQGFHMAGAWSYVVLTTALFPLSVIMMATYDGSLFAVLLTAIALLVFSATRWNFQPMLSRCIIFGQR
ncbi:MAG TPA: hypothetical protein VFP11_00785 [Candidatus Angelobacter sp.]|nr:hypothetical protein [Candidatus Angelobacter sp.]